MAATKQNMFASVEVIIHMYELLQLQIGQCQGEIQDNSISRQRTESPECLLAKARLLQTGRNMNFQLHVSQLLKMYSGDLNLLGMDYFAQLSKMHNHDQEILYTQYSYFQTLITQSVTTLFVFNQLDARDTLTENFK